MHRTTVWHSPPRRVEPAHRGVHRPGAPHADAAPGAAETGGADAPHLGEQAAIHPEPRLLRPLEPQAPAQVPVAEVVLATGGALGAPRLATDPADSFRRMLWALRFPLVVLTSVGLFAGCGSDSTGSGSVNATTDAATERPKPKDVAPQPFNVSGLLNGDAKPELPGGDNDKVAVIAKAPLERSNALDSATLTFAFRNNTDEAISHVDWTATARAGGKLVATGSSQGTQPAQIAPGEVGMAFIYFESGKSIPRSGVKYEFSAETTEADTAPFNTAPLVVVEANRNGAKIVGSATNKTGKKLTGPYGAEVYCFRGNDITGKTGDFAEENREVQPGGTVHFTVDLGNTPCKTFAVGVSGYFA